MGIKSYNFMDNFSQFIFLLCVAFSFILIAILLYYIQKFREIVKNLLIKTYKDLKWNGVIRTLTVSYLKIGIFVSLKIKNEYPNLI